MSVAYMTEESGLNCWFLCRWGDKPGEVTLKPVSCETGNALIGNLNEDEFILLYNALMCTVFTPDATTIDKAGIFIPDPESDNADIRGITAELERALREDCADLRGAQQAWLERMEALEAQYNGEDGIDWGAIPEGMLPDLPLNEPVELSEELKRYLGFGISKAS